MYALGWNLFWKPLKLLWKCSLHPLSGSWESPRLCKWTWYRLKSLRWEPPQIIRSMDCPVGGNTDFVMGSESPTDCYHNSKEKM